MPSLIVLVVLPAGTAADLVKLAAMTRLGTPTSIDILSHERVDMLLDGLRIAKCPEGRGHHKASHEKSGKENGRSGIFQPTLTSSESPSNTAYAFTTPRSVAVSFGLTVWRNLAMHCQCARQVVLQALHSPK